MSCLFVIVVIMSIALLIYVCLLFLYYSLALYCFVCFLLSVLSPFGCLLFDLCCVVCEAYLCVRSCVVYVCVLVGGMFLGVRMFVSECLCILRACERLHLCECVHHSLLDGSRYQN